MRTLDQVAVPADPFIVSPGLRRAYAAIPRSINPLLTAKLGVEPVQAAQEYVGTKSKAIKLTTIPVNLMTRMVWAILNSP